MKTKYRTVPAANAPPNRAPFVFAYANTVYGNPKTNALLHLKP